MATKSDNGKENNVWAQEQDEHDKKKRRKKGEQGEMSGEGGGWAEEGGENIRGKE